MSLAFMPGADVCHRPRLWPAPIHRRSRRDLGAHLGWINRTGTPLSVLGLTWALVIFTILGLVEYVVNQLPSTPARTAPMQLGGRLVMGSLAGASLAAAGATSLLVGIIGAIVGVLVVTYGGYHAIGTE